MSSSTSSPAIARFETQLRLSAEIFAARSLASGASNEAAAIGFARRFGFLSGEDTSLAALGPANRQSLSVRLEEENQRLLRAARRNAPGYDLGRHIAVRRAINALSTDETRAATTLPLPEKPLSGRELNNRFRRSAGRGAPERKALSRRQAPLARAV